MGIACGAFAFMGNSVLLAVWKSATPIVVALEYYYKHIHYALELIAPFGFRDDIRK